MSRVANRKSGFSGPRKKNGKSNVLREEKNFVTGWLLRFLPRVSWPVFLLLSHQPVSTSCVGYDRALISDRRGKI